MEEGLRPNLDALVEQLRSHQAKVGVIGLGYVGLPLALAFAEGGFRVLGFDVDGRKIEALSNGESYIEYLANERISAMTEVDRLDATSDFDRLAEPDALLICVPTPLDRFREPDLSYVEATTRAISERLRPGQLVILESTTYPGTTDELMVPLLEESGLKAGEDFFVAYSPEREDPGNPDFGTTGIPKVVGGYDTASAELAEALYEGVITRTVRVGSARAAEATKLTENIFRAVNIALVNELKTIYDAMGIDVWEVLDAAATKPFGFMRFTPGPGWGGHCIPIDPFYLSWKAREFGQRARFIELAGEVNIEMPRYVIDKLQEALNLRRKPLKESKILMLGVAYKPNVADPRESPAFELLELLLEKGAQVSYHDPYIPELPAMRNWPELPAMHSVELGEAVLAAQDAVLVVTDHKGLDWEAVAEHAELVIDTRGIYREERQNVVRA